MSIDSSFKVEPIAWHSFRELIGIFSIAVAMPSFWAVRSIMTSHTVLPIESQIFNHRSLSLAGLIYQFNVSTKLICSGFTVLCPSSLLRSQLSLLRTDGGIGPARFWWWAALRQWQAFPLSVPADTSSRCLSPLPQWSSQMAWCTELRVGWLPSWWLLSRIPNLVG